MKKMKQGEIIQSCVDYLINESKEFRNLMPNEKYFFIQGKMIKKNDRSEDDYDENIFAKGVIIDVLADTIEKDKYFSWHDFHAKIFPIYDGEKFGVYGKFTLKYQKNGIFIPIKKIKPKKYLDILRTPEGFKQTAILLNREKNLEKIISRIYNSR